MKAAALEQRQEQPSRKELFIKAFDEQWKKVHQGTPPETGLKRNGERERKEVCEDVQLKHKERGLFLVADGVSSSQGWMASRETARVMYEELGETLDAAVDRLLRTEQKTETELVEQATTYIAQQMKVAISKADSRVKMLAAQERISGSATTLTLAKLVELPGADGAHIQRLFFASVGDSRLYIQRKEGALEQVTQDDSRLQYFVEIGKITPEQAKQIDQAVQAEDLAPELKSYARGRNLITNSIGLGAEGDSEEVYFVDLQPGDRFLIVSDGVSDPLLDSEMNEVLDQAQDDQQAEEQLQQQAFSRALQGTHPRAKADDASALVHTVGERGPDRAYVRQATPEQGALVMHQNKLLELQKGLVKASAWVANVTERLAQLNTESLHRDRLILSIEKQKAREAEASYRYHMEKAFLDTFDLLVPPRYSAGDEVSVWRDDFDPPGFDRQHWKVLNYDADAKNYLLQGPGGTMQEVGRYALETKQPGHKLRVGDEVPDPAGPHASIRYRIQQINQIEGTLVLANSSVINVIRRPIQELDQLFADLSTRAHRSYRSRGEAQTAYEQAHQGRTSLEKQLEQIAILEAKQQALNARGDTTQTLQTEIEQLERVRAEYQALVEKQKGGTLTSKEEQRRKQLALLVLPSRTASGIDDLIAQKRKERAGLKSRG